MTIQALKDAALAATPGPWKAEVNEKSASINILGVHGDKMRCRASDGHGSIVIVECWTEYDDQPFAPMLPEQVANGQFIALANPSAILSLIASHEAMTLALSDINRVLSETRALPSHLVGNEIEWCIDHARTALSTLTKE